MAALIAARGLSTESRTEACASCAQTMTAATAAASESAFTRMVRLLSPDTPGCEVPLTPHLTTGLRRALGPFSDRGDRVAEQPTAQDVARPELSAIDTNARHSDG